MTTALSLLPLLALAVILAGRVAASPRVLRELEWESLHRQTTRSRWS